MKNDYRDYIIHSAFHKYISRKRGKNGEWQYVYPGLGSAYENANKTPEKKKDNFITRAASISKENHKKEHVADRETSKRRRKSIDPKVDAAATVVSDTFSNMRKAAIYKKQDKKLRAKKIANTGKSAVNEFWNNSRSAGAASSARGKNTVNSILPGAIKSHYSDEYKKKKKRERIARRGERNSRR